MTTLVDKLVELGIPREVGNQIVFSVFEITPGYIWSMWEDSYPLDDIYAVASLKRQILAKKAYLDTILTPEQYENVYCFLTTGQLPRTHTFRSRAACQRVVSTNPYLV